MPELKRSFDEIIDLFLSLSADDDQLDFPVVYASARQGIAGLELSDMKDNISPIFEVILNTVPLRVAMPRVLFQMGNQHLGL
jgi:GTP-binding protein